MLYSIIAIVVVGVVCFIAGTLVYRNNAKLFDKLIGQVEVLPDVAKKEVTNVLQKYNINIKI